jgi:TfoX/Sxy family transcriptional regulator of competence genes
MAFDHLLAERVHAALPADPSNFIVSKKMFGGIAWTMNGHLVFGILGDEFMVRLGNEGAHLATQEPGVRLFDLMGQKLNSAVMISGEYLDDVHLQSWIDQALAFVETLPPK